VAGRVHWHEVGWIVVLVILVNVMNVEPILKVDGFEAQKALPGSWTVVCEEDLTVHLSLGHYD
jgi:hypothetical protein